ncbi:CLUMA_CG001059, isoform A [Clunio marinus]|uniref:CLUMA_CG001059, isoform A n=1 Tax=Clunio marinus TaxID=568069 RepID=A0A1J1HM08_9DIPT|nr:CLUMA_CG001059, isoform A [Clunio marinus]
MLPHLCNEHPYTSLDMLFRWAVYYESRCLFSQVDVKAVEVVGNYFRVVPLDGRDRPALTVAVHKNSSTTSQSRKWNLCETA